MISDAEVRREARRARVEPRIIDLDYALGWALAGLAVHSYLQPRLIFKGGTCLRKCYFPKHRFSEDLDFTATASFDWQQLEWAIRDAIGQAQARSGIDFMAREPRLEVVNDEYGRESFQMRIYYRGPHRTAGSPRAIRLDVTHDEAMVFDPVLLPVIHRYSDAGELGVVHWLCYALDEVMVEKLRAVLGQRRYAVSRDLYDIRCLLRAGIDPARICTALPAKLAAKDLSIETVTAEHMLSRRVEFRTDWDRNLVSLLQPEDLPDFDEVWADAAAFVRSIIGGLPGRPPKG